MKASVRWKSARAFIDLSSAGSTTAGRGIREKVGSMKITIMMGLLLFGALSLSEAGSDASHTTEVGSNKGLTLSDIGRGLQSAANNIGNEIPKIGPAIGKMFKQESDKKNESKNPAPQHPPKANDR